MADDNSWLSEVAEPATSSQPDNSWLADVATPVASMPKSNPGSTGNPEIDSLIKNTPLQSTPSTPISVQQLASSSEVSPMADAFSRYLIENHPDILTGLAKTGIGIERLADKLKYGVTGEHLDDPDVLKGASQIGLARESQQSPVGKFESLAAEPEMWAGTAGKGLLSLATLGALQGGESGILNFDPNAFNPNATDTFGDQLAQGRKGAEWGAAASPIGYYGANIIGRAGERIGDSLNWATNKLTGGLDVPTMSSIMNRLSTPAINSINAATDAINKVLPNSAQLTHVPPTELTALQTAAQNLGLNIGKNDSASVIRDKINDAIQGNVGDIGGDFAGNLNTGLRTNIGISKQYDANRNIASGLYTAAQQEGKGKAVASDTLQDDLDSTIKDLQSRINSLSPSEARALPKLLKARDAVTGTPSPSILDQYGNPMKPNNELLDVNTLVDLKQAVNEGFNGNKFGKRGDSIMGDLGNSIDSALTDAGNLYPKFGEKLDAANDFWKNSVARTFRDNKSIRPFWQPQDYYWANDSGILDPDKYQAFMSADDAAQHLADTDNMPISDTLARAQKTLPSIKNVGQVQSLEQALPPREMREVMRGKLLQSIGGTEKSGEYNMDALSDLLNPRSEQNPGIETTQAIASKIPGAQDKLDAIKAIADDLSQRGYTGAQLPEEDNVQKGIKMIQSAAHPTNAAADAIKNLIKGVVGQGYNKLQQFGKDVNATPFDNVTSQILGNVAGRTAGTESGNTIYPNSLPKTAPQQKPMQPIVQPTLRPQGPAVPATGSAPQLPQVQQKVAPGAQSLLNQVVPSNANPTPNSPNAGQQDANLKSTITPIAQQFGNDPNLVHKIALAESGGNPNARNPNSTALGLYQFTAPTWRTLVQQYGPTFGIGMRDRMDPVKNTIMANALLSQNKTALQNTLGRTPTDGELYLAHFLGAPGAQKILQNINNNQVTAARLLPAAAQSNPNIFFDKGRPILPGEMYQKVLARLGT